MMLWGNLAKSLAKRQDPIPGNGVSNPLSAQKDHARTKQAIDPGKGKDSSSSSATYQLHEIFRPIVRVGAVDDAHEVLHAEQYHDEG